MYKYLLQNNNYDHDVQAKVAGRPVPSPGGLQASSGADGGRHREPYHHHHVSGRFDQQPTRAAEAERRRETEEQSQAVSAQARLGQVLKVQAIHHHHSQVKSQVVMQAATLIFFTS